MEEQRSSGGRVISLDMFRDYQYWLLPGNCPPDFPQMGLHNDAFRQWHGLWTQVFKQIANEKVRSEDFWRQQMVCVLTKDSNIVAIHLYSFFNLQSEAALSHSYFKINYKPEHLGRLQALEIKTVMSMEYFTINPEFRQHTTGAPLSSLVLGLGFRILRRSGYDAAIAPCRRDLKVDKKAQEFGAENLSEEFIHHGVPVVNMVLKASDVKAHPLILLNQTVDLIWDSRRDYSGFKLIEESKAKTEAA